MFLSLLFSLLSPLSENKYIKYLKILKNYQDGKYSLGNVVNTIVITMVPVGPGETGGDRSVRCVVV